MEQKCKKCISKYVCTGDIAVDGSLCVRFHKALESKLRSHNNDSFQSLFWQVENAVNCLECDDKKKVESIKSIINECRSGTKNVS